MQSGPRQDQMDLPSPVAFPAGPWCSFAPPRV